MEFPRMLYRRATERHLQKPESYFGPPTSQISNTLLYGLPAKLMLNLNKTVHVFRSFTRLGSSNLDGSNKVDQFEVELEDWLLENLNESFVVPEDFNMYHKLVRPTAKGIFVYLYLWFFASQGKEVEKDYSELCALLNVRTYDHVSKICETMGQSLSDLVNIGYLESWDIRPMSSKSGYKLMLTSLGEWIAANPQGALF